VFWTGFGVTFGFGVGLGAGAGAGSGTGTGSVAGSVVVSASTVGDAPAATASANIAPAASSARHPATPANAFLLTPNLLTAELPSPKLTALDCRSDPEGCPRRVPTLAGVAKSAEKLIVDNRRARHDYHLLERVEAGLVLTGTEVKSLREGRASLQQAYADMRGGEAWLVGAHISVYDQGNLANHDPDRDRKLLLHRKEVDSLAGKVAQKGLTLVPTKLYFKNGRAKVELALARGKEGRDKRRDIAKREADRDMQRALKSRR
jgi:SsrA-binding protein